MKMTIKNYKNEPSNLSNEQEYEWHATDDGWPNDGCTDEFELKLGNGLVVNGTYDCDGEFYTKHFNTDSHNEGTCLDKQEITHWRVKQ